MYISTSDERHILKNGEFYIINSNKIHATRSSGRVKAFLVQIPYSYMELYIKKLKYISFHECFCDAKETENYKRLVALLEKMADIYKNAQKGYELILMSCVNEFLYILYTCYSDEKKTPEKEQKQIARLKEVLSYVSENYRDMLTLDEAAQIASLNPQYFCRVFKQCMGVTFLEYVNQVRLNHVHDEILETDDTITDILNRNGFTNYRVFSRMFKAQYGMTPGALRHLE